MKKRAAVLLWDRLPARCNRKPRDSREVQKRLTDEQKTSKCVKKKTTCQSRTKTHLEVLSMKKENIDTNSLAHTKWNCKYHIVFPSTGKVDRLLDAG